jgi:hypothetical protein
MKTSTRSFVFAAAFFTSFALAASAYAGNSAVKSPTHKEPLVRAELIDTSALLPNIKLTIRTNYEDFVVTKAMKKSDRKGNVTYEALISNTSYDFVLYFDKDGQFVKDSDYLADMVWYLVAASFE